MSADSTSLLMRSPRVGMMLGVAIAIVVFAGWWGWDVADQARSEREQVARLNVGAVARKPLLLVEPPVAMRKTLETPKPSVGGASAARKAVAGGARLDPLVEMWEAAYLRPPTTSNEPLTPPRWVIVGVANRGEQQMVMVQRGSDPTPHYYKIGDTLPGGSRIVWVKPGVVGIATSRRERIELPLGQ